MSESALARYAEVACGNALVHTKTLTVSAHDSEGVTCGNRSGRLLIPLTAVSEYAPLQTASTAGSPHVPHDALAVHLGLSPLHRGSQPALVTCRAGQHELPASRRGAAATHQANLCRGKSRHGWKSQSAVVHPASYHRRNKPTPTVFVTWVASSWALI
jgi:hypothetical protein